MTAAAAVINRIAAATSALRVRADDAERLQRNGATAELRARVDQLVTRLEQIADALEAALQ